MDLRFILTKSLESSKSQVLFFPFMLYKKDPGFELADKILKRGDSNES